MNIEKLLADYYDYKYIFDNAKKELDALKAEIISAMDADGVSKAVSGGYSASVCYTVNHTIDKARLERDFPEIVANYTKESKPIARLTVKAVIA